MAAFFWIHAGADNNVGTINNWSATSGGGTNGATPSVTSDVTYDGAGANGNDASTVAASVSFLSLTFTAGYTNTVTINTTRVLTIAGNFTDNTAHSWTVSGTGAMTISAASTITSGGKTFPGPVTFTGSNTKTLSGNWTITGALVQGSGTTVCNTATLTVGGLTMSSGGFSGTTAIALTGGTWSGAVAMKNSMTITGTVTISASVAYDTGTLTATSATVTATGSTLTIGASTTLSTSAITWNNITTGATTTLTINSILTVTGTLNLGANATTFAGTTGFTVGTFTSTGTSVISLTFANTVTYTITTALNCFNSRTGSIVTFTSDHASNRAIITLQNASSTCNVLASFTRIDASAGRPINSFNGVITDSPNVFSQTNVLYKPPTSFDRAGRRFIVSNKNKSVIYQ